MSTSPINDPPWPGPYAAPPPAQDPAALTVVTAVAVAVGAALLGVPYALLWALIAPDIPVVKVDADQVTSAQPEPEQFVAGDGWFVLLGVAFGVAAAVGAWFLGRRARGPAVLVALAAGSVVAGVVAGGLGQWIGLADYQHALAAAASGTHLTHPPDLRIAIEVRAAGAQVPMPIGVPLVLALAAVVTYTLFAGWFRHGSLRSDSAVTAAGDPGQAAMVSWGSSAPPDLPAAPAPPEPGEAGSPRD